MKFKKSLKFWSGLPPQPALTPGKTRESHPQVLAAPRLVLTPISGGHFCSQVTPKSWSSPCQGVPGAAQPPRPIGKGIRTHLRGGRGSGRALFVHCPLPMSLLGSLPRATGLGVGNIPVDLFSFWRGGKLNSQWNVEAAPPESKNQPPTQPQSPSSASSN